MIYQAYQAYADLMAPLRLMAHATSEILCRPWPGLLSEVATARLAAACEVVARTGLTHRRPDFAIHSVKVGGREVAVTEEVVHATPFCNLLRFRKEGAGEQPRVLVVAPMSGHFATLLRGTVRTLVRDHDVYITDWINVRDVSLLAGRFDLDAFIDHLIRFLEFLGDRAHLMAVCQPAVPALIAASALAQQGSPHQPLSLTLMAGPIDTRVNPTEVNELAAGKPIEWFEQHLIGTVPMRYKGGMRRVYPGFVQISSFMAMNLDRHANSFIDLYHHRVNDRHDQAEMVRDFYEEYFAMMDLPAEFYLETVRKVFQEYHLPRGVFDYRGLRIEPRALRRTALLTIEGERDDICAVGQTVAAQELCTGLRPYMKRHHVQTGVGHYGVFNGKRWEAQIYPLVREFIHLSQ